MYNQSCVHISLNLSITTSFQYFYYRHHDFITLRSMWVTDDHGHVPFVAIHNHTLLFSCVAYHRILNKNNTRWCHQWSRRWLSFQNVGKAQVYLKYMHVIRLAASRVSNLGWVSHDEQFRLRKAKASQSSWADVDVELWLLYVSTPEKTTDNLTFRQPFLNGVGQKRAQGFQLEHVQKGIRTCWGYNKGRCTCGNNCRFIHKCSVLRKPPTLGLQ